jgi:PAS domain S-box-containing protein
MSNSHPLTDDILDSLSEGLFTVDKNFKINFFNKAAEKILGYNRQEVIGKFCKHVCNADMCLTRCPIAMVLETGKNVNDLEGIIRHLNGNDIRIRLNAAVLRDEGGEPVGGVISFRDITYLESIMRDLEKFTQYYGMIGHSKKMQEIFQLIEEIHDSDVAVLIMGESGTGKEMVANAIQASSLRSDKPFVKVNCSVFSTQLLASELFGHVKGAFTGAVKDRLGRFELAHTGTIFLDEVAEMSHEMQVQLLRILQEGTFERVGESITRKVDVRVIAATNKDLKKALQEGRFREDLYYRLNVIPIEIPPLRERTEDIPHLVQHFIDKFSLLYRKNINDLENEALDVIIRYSWPGNIRELENALEYAFARAKNDNNIQLSSLPANLREGNSRNSKIQRKYLNNGEVIRILDLLEKYHWNRTRVANILGIGRTTLWRKLQKYGIESSR